MTTRQFISEASQYSDSIWLERPTDIVRMLQRNKGLEKNLATSVFCFADTSSLKDAAWSWYRLGKKREGDLATILSIAAERLDGAAKTFETYYSMEDAAHLMEDAARAMREVSSFEELSSVSYAFEHCMVLLHYWCDISIPWSDLSPVHAQLMG